MSTQILSFFNVFPSKLQYLDFKYPKYRAQICSRFSGVRAQIFARFPMARAQIFARFPRVRANQKAFWTYTYEIRFFTKRLQNRD